MILLRQKLYTKRRIKVKQGKKLIHTIDNIVGGKWPELISGPGPAHIDLQKADYLLTNYSPKHLNKKFRFRHSNTKAVDALEALQLKMQSSPRTNYTGQRIDNVRELRQMVREERQRTKKRK